MGETLGPLSGREYHHMGDDPGCMQAFHDHLEMKRFDILIGQDRALAAQTTCDGLGAHLAEDVLANPDLVFTIRKPDRYALFARHEPKT